MIRKTLGWCDEHGNPQHEMVTFSYSELEKHAGLSHSMIRLALDQAEKSGFVRCVREGQASTRSESGSSAVYELAWDEAAAYIKDPKKFVGFFAGEGNRTYIPNQFLDHLLPHEPLAMIQVVGTVIRFSIGFQNKFGHRRQRVALSYRDIQRYAKIASPSVLSKTIREAVAKNYIERVEEGYFDPNGGILSRAAHYAIKWAQVGHESPSTPKSVAAENHSEKVSGTTPKTEAADHSEKFSGIQIKQTNNILKQQGAAAVTFERLKAEGFDERAAEAIAKRYPAERIDRQLRWIDRRTIKSNRLGLLRAAIDQDWPPPGEPAKLRRLNFDHGGAPRDRGLSFADAMRQAKDRMPRRPETSTPRP
jgi:DNA-binding HxlR family transcriptional regulator